MRAKLVARAFSLAHDVTGAPSAEVQAAFDASAREVKTAIAVILTGASLPTCVLHEEHPMPDAQQLAQQILDAVGGSANIADVENCMTRLRVEVVSDRRI